MKKIFLLIFSCLLSISAYSVVDVSGHFYKDLSGSNIPVGNIASYFSQYLDLPDSTTFEIVRDETDPMGYRHISYQQHVGEYWIRNAMVLVHAHNGVVLSINGDVLTRSQLQASANQTVRVSPRQALKKVSASDNQAPVVIIKVLEDGNYVCHKAYRIKSDFNTCYKYIDVYTGEVIKKESLVFSADEIGTAYTMYNGAQSFTCHSIDGAYYLYDLGRNFATFDATHADPIDYVVADENFNLAMENFRQSCADFSNPSLIWNSPYHRYLTEVTIDYLPCWSPKTGDSIPDLYLKIYDSEDSLLYTTGYMEDATFPAIFTIPAGVETQDGYLSFKVFDYDSNDVEDEICTFATEYATSVFEITFADSAIMGSLYFSESGIQPALDIHWGMQKTMDFYRLVLDRNGHDNNGGILYQYYNPTPDNILFSTMPDNAFAYYGLEPNMMVYGEGMSIFGDPTSMRPVVSLDIMAHEFTHLVTAHNGNGGLLYEDESGALNESFSDIMAMAVVDYVKDSCNWEIGADVMLNVPNMRSMSDPYNSAMSPQPKYYQGRYWANLGDYSDTGDHGGVHTNSGIQNYWFYLLAHGDSGINEAGQSFSVTGIGIADATKIAYYNLLYYLAPEASFYDSRWGSVQACAELFGASSPQMQAVVDAWDAVGVVADSPATGVDNALHRTNATKRIINGHLFILRDGHKYTASGTMVE